MAAQNAVMRDAGASRPGAEREPGEAPARSLGLAALLAATADRHPERIALIDQPDKPSWCGRPAITWTFAAAREIAARLTAGLQALRLPPRSPVGLCMAGITESHLALLAIEQAGHLPCLLPVTWDEARLLQAVEAAQVQAVITQGQIGEDRPAERLCRVAARYFPLRFVAAFGPHVPDGVLGIDRLVLDHRADAAFGSAEVAGLVTFAGEETPRPVLRDGDGLTAATAQFLVPARIEPGDRIVSLLPPADLRGLVPGLAAALLAGATLESHPVFDSASLAATLARDVPTHLVAPGWMEPGLGRTEVPARLRSLVFVHRAPVRLSGRAPGRRGVTDVVVLDELALVAGRREAQDVALMLAAPERAGAGGLLQLRREPDGRLAVRGPAASARVLQRGIARNESVDEWTVSRFRATRLGGVATALEPA
ncbi:AMP-binding protein [Methylobacterium sp. WSM2598]|uniref:AMP-binding protein n=1 Tax=Methylobacterium sp. WSM2598 TaxID=398261 RepID=UPI00036B552E|nr:AMP-binding protein [Methylobacterium sp. WSM2598]